MEFLTSCKMYAIAVFILDSNHSCYTGTGVIPTVKVPITSGRFTSSPYAAPVTASSYVPTVERRVHPDATIRA
eukprot:1164150-Amphidinium_carterae.2